MNNQSVYLRDTECCTRYGVSRATIWRWVESGAFPQPVKLSPGCTRWKRSKLEQWEEKQAGGEA